MPRWQKPHDTMAQENKALSENMSDREIVSTRIFDASRDTLFKAFANPDELTQWWGPKGFTTTIQEFDFRPGGICRLVLHGPNGTDYHNEKVFVEIIKPERIVFRHLQPMHDFEMAMIFSEAVGRKTKLTWRMVFDSAEACAKIRSLVTEANEQNYDRLEAFLKKQPLETKP